MPLLAAVASGFGWHAPERFERFGTAQIRGGAWIVEGVRARAERYDPSIAQPRRPAGHARRGCVATRFHRQRAVPEPRRGGDRHHRPGARRPARRGAADAARSGRDVCRGPAAHVPGSSIRRPARLRARTGDDRGDASAGGENVDPLRRAGQRRDPPHAGRSLPERRDRGAPRRRGCSSSSSPSWSRRSASNRAATTPTTSTGTPLATVDAAPPDLVTRTAALLHDIAKPPTHVGRSRTAATPSTTTRRSARTWPGRS